MAKQAKNDKLEKRLRYAERLRLIMMELPEICFDYIISIETTTSILTRINYAGDLRTFFRYLYENGVIQCEPKDAKAEDISLITTRDIEMFLEYLTVYRDTDSNQILENDNLGKKRKLSAIRSFFKFMQRRGFIEHDPSSVIATPKIPTKPILSLTHDEVQNLITTIDQDESLTAHQLAYSKHTKERNMALIMLFLGTGIRISECVGLDIDDINFEDHSFRVRRKGGKIAILYFSDEVKDALLTYLDIRKTMTPEEGHEKALFLSLQNKRITERAVQNMVSKYSKASVPLKHITPHKFRSTFGTELYQNTGDIYLVADVLGHEDVNTTKRHYAKMSDDNRRYAATAVKMFEKKDDEE